MTSNHLLAVRNRSGPQFYRQLVSAWDTGHAVLPIENSATPDEIEGLINAFRPASLIDESTETKLPSPLPVPEGTALVVATSGSSRRPKGVLLSHAALQASAEATRQRLNYSVNERWLCCLPWTHIGGLMTLVRSQAFGTKPIIHDRFNAKQIAKEHRASLISLVPTALIRLLEAGADLSHFSKILLGGGPIPRRLVDKCRAEGLPIVCTYGMTETCGGCVYDGLALNRVDVRIVEGEEIALRGPMLMDGYRLDPELSAQALKAGWFHTNDRGRIRPDGKLEVIGRLDDIIITGGQKVSPTEVESSLMNHPAIKEVAVVGLPDAEWGEIVAALIVPKKGKPPELDEIRDFISAKTARHKAPRRIQPVETLPRTPTGKIARQKCRDLFDSPQPQID